MSKAIVNFFVYSAYGLLCLTALAKLISACGSAGILETHDPVFSISFRDLFVMVGGLELIIVSVGVFSKNLILRVCLIAWLATDYLLYRFGEFWIGYSKPCRCLGTLTDTLHISPETGDMASKYVLAYLLIGSYACLYFLLRKSGKTGTVAIIDSK